MAENKKSDLLPVAGMIGLFLLVLGVAAYFLVHQYVINSQLEQQDNNQQQQTTTPTPNDLTANWNVVTDTALGFSMKYPNGFFDVGHEPKIVDIRTNPNGREFPGTPQELTINSVTYYYWHEQNGAAGHSYFYEYYQPKENTLFYVELDTSESRCENYLPLQAGNTQQAANYNDCVAKNNSRQVVLQQIVNTFNLTK